MGDVQFSLFFVALLVGYVLVHLRLVRFEEHLQKLSSLRGLDDRLRSLDDRLRLLAESFDKVRLDRVEGQLARLHDDLEDLREATSGVQQAVVQIPQPVMQAPPVVLEPAPKVVTRAADLVLSRVETRLQELGYHAVRVLDDLSGVQLEHDLELRIECERGGMPVKGRVLVQNGTVRDLALQTVVQMFP